jgi:hypothetical protein
MMTFATLKTDNIKDLPDLLTRYDSPLLQVASGELRQYLTALLNALFWKATKPEALFDESTAKQTLQDEKRLQSWLGVAESALGTHNLKYPNANVSQGAVFEQNVVRDTERNIQPWVSSRSVALTRTVGGAGNAAWAAEIRLLGTEFLLDVQRVRMADVLAQREGAVWDALLSLGLREGDAEKLGGVLRQRLQQSDKGYLDRLSKQVFFPLRDDEDVVITPVQHFGLAREFHTRFFQRVKKDNPQQERFQTRALKVGGANPINAGPYNAEIAGLYRHLMALPPAQDTPSDPERLLGVILARCRASGTVFTSQGAFDVQSLDQPVVQRSSRRNRRQREGVAEGIAWKLLADARFLRQWGKRQGGHPLEQDLPVTVNPLEQLWLDPSRTTRLDKSQLQALADMALIRLKSRLEHTLGAADEALLQTSVVALLREFEP